MDDTKITWRWLNATVPGEFVGAVRHSAIVRPSPLALAISPEAIPESRKWSSLSSSSGFFNMVIVAADPATQDP